jgi:transcriptional regulator with XRE-family HTH domain
MERELSRKLGQAARTARASLGLSQADVADRLSLSVEFYGRLERGATLPSVPTLFKMASVLGVTSDQLLGRGGKAHLAEPRVPESSRDHRVLLRRLERASPGAIRLTRLLLAELETAAGSARRSRRPRPVAPKSKREAR